MKLISCWVVFALAIVCNDTNAQISFKTEYIGNSPLLDDNGNRIADSEGAALVYKGGINIPFSTKVDKKNLPIIWGIGASASYTSFNNEKITEDLVLSEMLGIQATLYHIRPLNEKWYMMANIGLGIYTPNTKLSKIRYRNFLGNIGVIFIKKIRPTLEIGFGTAINNTFGYPMLFPALYFNWMYEGRFIFSLSMMDGGEMSVKYNVNKQLSLSLIAEMCGQGVMLKKDNQEMMFSHQYIIMGVRPEFKVNKYISIPITVGCSIMRSTGYDKRSLKGIFSNTGTNSDFKNSFYVSGGIKLGF